MPKPTQEMSVKTPTFLLCVKDVAKRLNVSDSQVYALVQSGKLKAYRITTSRQGGLRFSEEMLQEYLKSTETQAALPKGVRHLLP